MSRQQTNNRWKDDPFPLRLNDLLLESGKKQDDLALKCGVSRQSISKWMRGETIPDVAKLRLIAQYFNVSYDYLLGESDAKQRENVNIAKETGLSEKAIDALRGFARDAQKPTSAAAAIRMVVGQAGYYANVLASLNALIENENVLAALSNYLCVGGFPSGDYTINDKYELVRNRETTGNGGFIAFETREVVDGTMLLQSYYFDKIRAALSMLRDEMQQRDK